MKGELFPLFFCLFAVCVTQVAYPACSSTVSCRKGEFPADFPESDCFVYREKRCETDEKCHRRVQSFTSLLRSDRRPLK